MCTICYNELQYIWWWTVASFNNSKTVVFSFFYVLAKCFVSLTFNFFGYFLAYLVHYLQVYVVFCFLNKSILLNIKHFSSSISLRCLISTEKLELIIFFALEHHVFYSMCRFFPNTFLFQTHTDIELFDSPLEFPWFFSLFVKKKNKNKKLNIIDEEKKPNLCFCPNSLNSL